MIFRLHEQKQSKGRETDRVFRACVFFFFLRVSRGRPSFKPLNVFFKNGRRRLSQQARPMQERELISFSRRTEAVPREVVTESSRNERESASSTEDIHPLLMATVQKMLLVGRDVPVAKGNFTLYDDTRCLFHEYT